MNEQQLVQALASQLDDQGVAALGALVEKVAAAAGQRAVEARASQSAQVSKLAQELAAAGFEPQEVAAHLDKLAAQQKQAQEVQLIADDCNTMGLMMGKVAFQTFIGLCADHVKSAEEAGSSEKKPDDELTAEEKAELEAARAKAEAEAKSKEESEGEKAKEAAHQQKVARLAQILGPVLFGQAG